MELVHNIFKVGDKVRFVKNVRTVREEADIGDARSSVCLTLGQEYTITKITESHWIGFDEENTYSCEYNPNNFELVGIVDLEKEGFEYSNE